MANEHLNQPVVVQPGNIDITLLPKGWPVPYSLYVVQNSTDFGNVASKANQAAGGAYDAQVKNDEQDLTLTQHETRIVSAEKTLINHEARISSSEAKIADHESRIESNTQNISRLNVRVSGVESGLASLKADAVLMSTSTNQVIQSLGGALIVGKIATPTTDKIQSSDSVSAEVSYKVAGLKVIGARQTGWSSSSGSANKGVFNADLLFSASAAYNQADIQALSLALTATRQRLKALEDMAREHGLID